MTLAVTLRDTPEGCILQVRVHPGARKNEITGVHAGALKISLTAPPADGRANDALIAFLAERLQIPRSRLTLLTGASSRSKVLRIQAIHSDDLLSAITKACPAGRAP